MGSKKTTSRKDKPSRKRSRAFTVIGIAVLAVIALTGIITLYTFLRPLRLVAVQSGEREILAIRQAIAAYQEKTGIRMEIVSQTGSTEAQPSGANILAASLDQPQTDILLFGAGKAAQSQSGRFRTLGTNADGNFVPAYLAWCRSADGLYALPLVADLAELNVNEALLKQGGTVLPLPGNSLPQALARAARTATIPGGFPVPGLVVALGDDHTLDTQLSAWILASQGSRFYAALSKRISENEDLEAALDLALPSNAPGQSASLRETLLAWDSFLADCGMDVSWFNAGISDLVAAVEGPVQPVAFLGSLSAHRRVSSQKLEDYTGGQLPSLAVSPTAVVSPLTLVGVRAGSWREKDALAFVDFLADAGLQYEIDRASGLGPTMLATANVDLQSRTVRELAMSHDFSANGLCPDSFSDARAARNFLAEVRTWLKRNYRHP